MFKTRESLKSIILAPISRIEKKESKVNPNQGEEMK